MPSKEILAEYKKQNPKKYAEKFGHLDNVSENIAPEVTESPVDDVKAEDKPNVAKAKKGKK